MPITDVGLFAVLGTVLVAPFTIKRVERNLEVFLFLMGTIRASVAATWDRELARAAVTEPLIKGIVPAVLVAGLLFHYGRPHVRAFASRLTARAPVTVIVAGLVLLLGLVSSVIMAIVAALVLVEMVQVLPLTRPERVRTVIVACFAIGLGAALTPLGEPLATIAISKLQGEPHHANFFFLIDKLALYIFPGIVVFAMLGFWTAGRRRGNPKDSDVVAQDEEEQTGLHDVGLRALKVYLFVVALVLLGAGFEPIIDRYLTHVGAAQIFWVNTSSAVLDNATLTAAELSPKMDLAQIQGSLLGLLVAGGMLIPGNIPNIIAAHKLRITSKEWASLGVPLGLAAMGVYFLILYVL